MKILLITLLVIVSCGTPKHENYKDLGNGYYFRNEKYYKEIVFYNGKADSTVVPPRVLQYNFDKDFIIVKSQAILKNRKGQYYWVISKQDQHNSLSGVDQQTFEKKLKELDLKLQLKDY